MSKQRTDLRPLFDKWWETVEKNFFPGQYDAFIAGWELCEQLQVEKGENVTEQEGKT